MWAFPAFTLSPAEICANFFLLMPASTHCAGSRESSLGASLPQPLFQARQSDGSHNTADGECAGCPIGSCPLRPIIRCCASTSWSSSTATSAPIAAAPEQYSGERRWHLVQASFRGLDGRSNYIRRSQPGSSQLSGLMSGTPIKAVQISRQAELEASLILGTERPR